MIYRPEIDGLRAIALIPVILFHGGISFFQGGFVGVDIFFVISGYLITTIILTEKQRGVFSLKGFYERRARRILPALFLVMFATLPFAWLWLMPSDLKNYSKSLVAVPLFSSNILFWLETGYWGATNELKPLLHTWSLGVEEQYYILFPLFLMLMWRFRVRWLLSTFILVAITSLMLSQWRAFNEPVSNFFLLPTRVWELAIGAIIAFYFIYRKREVNALQSNRIYDEVFSLLGLLMIIFSVITFNEYMPIPGVYSLIPTLGAGLIIIFTSTRTIVGKLLGSKVSVGIGLVSYSAYLWHQPIFAFAQHRALSDTSEQIIWWLIILTFSLSYLSWKYVEKPFRGKNVVTKKVLIYFSLVGSLFFIGIGLTGYLENGFGNRYSKNGVALASIEKKVSVNSGLSGSCDEKSIIESNCRTSDKPQILVWGDSYAMHLVPGILASNPEAEIIQMTKDGCGPFSNLAPISGNNVSWAEECLEFTKLVINRIKNSSTVKYVVLASPFDQYLSKNIKLLNRNGLAVNSSTNIVAEELNKTLSKLNSLGVEAIVFGPPPMSGANIGKCLVKAESRGLDLNNCNFKVEEISLESKRVKKILNVVEKNHRVVHLSDYICDDLICNAHDGAIYIYRDNGHLSIEGSEYLGKKHNFYKMITSS